MFSWLGRLVSSCLRPFSRYARMNRDDDGSAGGDDDGLLWSRDLEKHSHGEFSFAMVQANQVLEDQSQVETGRSATFVGVYDGHGGCEAAKYISDHLFRHFLKLAKETGTISDEIIKSSVSETENGFLTLVRRAYTIRPDIAAIGSCCLVGVIWKGTLYAANLGDSRAVIGYLDRPNKIVAEQLTRDHNASLEEVRKELKMSHPEDPQILVLRQGVWRIKGIIQVSRSIGDAYLKRPEFALDPTFPRFHLQEPLRRPVLRADPAMFIRLLQPKDKFIIFASDGLWENLTNQEAVEIVHNNPRLGIARRLIVSALMKAAKTRKIPYNEIKKLNQGTRRQIHDDITVVVLFIDHEMIQRKVGGPELSIRGYTDTAGPSNFDF
ncbi:hypothetical protein SASPL_126327 [Salvia splendens]|uniref:protein-serine/threonine phosphatase n=1 Tax=Salvia splendens TaxID=180675 RepID=A0A8X8XKK8_SALSN|nr:probable protein phosphatase 2C 43 isoform X1 [Salvia splendens]KAG6413613.1 hypothetical protein SASPL_126327 [Salvia splendens]